jgi:hypothetical protein
MFQKPSKQSLPPVVERTFRIEVSRGNGANKGVMHVHCDADMVKAMGDNPVAKLRLSSEALPTWLDARVLVEEVSGLKFVKAL